MRTLIGNRNGAQAPSRVLELMRAIVTDEGRSTLSVIASDIGLAPSTARRLAATLEADGLVAKTSHGRYAAGPAFMELSAFSGHACQLRNVSRQPLERLARQSGATAHLGILEGDMVTYLLRAGAPNDAIVTDVGSQLEAYCTGIGKVLLAGLPDDSLSAYLAAGDFVKLTSRTLNEVSELERELRSIRQQGYGFDRAEMFDRLHCIALPLHVEGKVVAAISVTRSGPEPSCRRWTQDLSLAKACVRSICRYHQTMQPRSTG